MITVTDTAHARLITLGQPDRANALSAGLVEALIAALEAARADGVKAVILAGDGKHFCAGFDFGGVEEAEEAAVADRFVRIETLLQMVRRSPFATVAVLQGAVFGAGADLAIACTWRVATPDARFRFPGFRFSVALGTRHLAATVGMDAARDILLANRVVGAEDALKLGLATHLAATKEAMRMAEAIVADIGDLDAWSIERILRLTALSTDEDDMADLVASVTRPGLHDRIARYRAAMAAGAKGKG